MVHQLKDCPVSQLNIPIIPKLIPTINMSTNQAKNRSSQKAFLNIKEPELEGSYFSFDLFSVFTLSRGTPQVEQYWAPFGILFPHLGQYNII